MLGLSTGSLRLHTIRERRGPLCAESEQESGRVMTEVRFVLHHIIRLIKALHFC